MSYTIKEIFLTIQGEGVNSGRVAIFCRFSGCNLWSGHEADRSNAICQFCDTDFVGSDGTLGGRFESAERLADAIASAWPGDRSGSRFVVLTGGEPALQIDDQLIDALHIRGFSVAVETNGTINLPDRVDWVCVSPKARAPVKITKGDELKVVVPQQDLDPCEYEHLNFQHFLVQPMDGPEIATNTRWAVDWCFRHPKWRLSLQTHKVLGIR